MKTRRIIIRAAIAVGGIVAAVLVWALAGLAGGIQVPVGGMSEGMPIGPVLGAAGGAVIVGWALLALLERVQPARSRRLWTIAAVVVAVLSLTGPLGTPGIAMDDRLWLIVVHGAVALAYIPAMSRTAKSTPATMSV